MLVGNEAGLVSATVNCKAPWSSSTFSVASGTAWLTALVTFTFTSKALLATTLSKASVTGKMCDCTMSMEPTVAEVLGRVLAQEPVRGRVLAQEPVQVPVGASACIPANWLAGRQAPRETRALGPARAPVRAMRRRHRRRRRPGPHRLPTGHSGVAAAQWFSLSHARPRFQSISQNSGRALGTSRGLKARTPRCKAKGLAARCAQASTPYRAADD